MTAETLKLYKLIILYFLNLATQEITNAILSDFILDHGYTDYFSIQETLNALTEDEMIQVHQTRTTSYYTITERGQEILDDCAAHLPYDTKQEIKQYLREQKIQITESTSVRTDYTKISSFEYLVTCSVMERKNLLFEISITVPTEELAVEMCSKFKINNDEIFSFLIKTLT